MTVINVCYTVDAPFVGGAEAYVARIATRLDRHRFTPTVVLREPTRPGSGLEQWSAEFRTAGVPVVTVPMDIPRKPFQLHSVLRVIAGLDPHVVHVNMPGPQDGQMGLLVPLARMAGAAGVVVTEHLPMVESTWKRRLVKRFSYHWVDRVATVCHANVTYLTEKQFVRPDKVAVIHNALDNGYGRGIGSDKIQIREQYCLPRDRTIVVFLGNLLRHKGLHRVVDALSEMPGLSWHLAVVGDGPERVPNENHIKSRGLADRATFTGNVSGEAVERILSAVDLLALPSTTEGMPYVILEAMFQSISFLISLCLGIYYTKKIFIQHDEGMYEKIYKTIPLKAIEFINNKPLVIYVLLMPLVVLIIYSFHKFCS